MEEYDNIPQERGHRTRRQYVNNHLLLAILTTLFCCIPFGIVSIVYAVQSNSAMMMGDTYMAQLKADKAKFWGLLALIIGLILNVFIFFLTGMSAVVNIAAQNG